MASSPRGNAPSDSLFYLSGRSSLQTEEAHIVTLPGREEDPNARAMVTFYFGHETMEISGTKTHSTFREVDREGSKAFRAIQDTVLLKLAQ